MWKIGTYGNGVDASTQPSDKCANSFGRRCSTPERLPLPDHGFQSNFVSLPQKFHPFPLTSRQLAVTSFFVTMFLSLVNCATGQVKSVSNEWKAHFTNTPVIENCVFERKVFSGNGETNFYQFRHQENAFLFRQIRNPADASSNHIPVMSSYAGRLGSNCWAIDWTADTFGVLKLFPNAGEIWRKPPEDGDALLVYSAERQIFGALYYGINNVNPATIEWLAETKFKASMMTGQRILGEVIKTTNGLPSVLEWHYENASDSKFKFVVEYNYEARSDLSYYPNEIRVFSKLNGQKKIAGAYKILVLKTSPALLDAAYFDPKRYFIKPTLPHPRTSMLLFSNNEVFNLSGDKPEKVVPLKSVNTISSSGISSGSHAVLIRLAILIFFAASVIGPLFFWCWTNKHKRMENNK